MCSKALAFAGIVLLAASGVTEKKTSPVQAKPLILEKEEGEQRTRRPRDIPMASSNFILKVDRKNGGSEHLVVGAEDMTPGQLIPRHKHLGQDEVLVIQSGSGHVWLGEQERDAHAGAVIFIPSGTWISMKNTGSENLSLVFIFSAPGFEEYLRCTSVAAGKQLESLSRQEFQDCEHKGHAVFEAK